MALKLAIECLEANHMKSFAAAAHYALGALANLESETALALAFYDAHGVKDPKCMSHMFAPGIFS